MEIIYIVLAIALVTALTELVKALTKLVKRIKNNRPSLRNLAVILT